MWRLILALLLTLPTSVWGAEDARDTYDFRVRCPQEGEVAKNNFATNPFYLDGRNFPICQCTSYVAHKLNEFWGNTSPRFTNQYYGLTRWGNAHEWFNAARSSAVEIGITGARDDFVWDESKFNAVFPGDVALWNKKVGYPDGHVAYVEAAGRDADGKGVAWVTVSEYNIIAYNYSRRTLNKSDPDFPDFFLHIDKDRIYCRANPTVDTCRTLMNRQVASTGSKYVGGLGGGGSSSAFNLKIDFDIMDQATGNERRAGTHQLRPGQVLSLEVDTETVNGDVRNYFRPGKDSVKVDYYYRVDDGDWVFYRRDTIQGYNLGAGHKLEKEPFTVPFGAREISFKAKIDASDDVSESNEGDNWSRIETFSVLQTRRSLKKLLEMTED